MSYDPGYAVKIVRRAESARRARMLEAVEASPYIVQYGREAMRGYVRISLYLPIRRKSMAGFLLCNPDLPRSFIERELLKALAYSLAREMVRPDEVPSRRAEMLRAWSETRH